MFLPFESSMPIFFTITTFNILSNIMLIKLIEYITFVASKFEIITEIITFPTLGFPTASYFCCCCNYDLYCWSFDFLTNFFCLLRFIFALRIKLFCNAFSTVTFSYVSSNMLLTLCTFRTSDPFNSSIIKFEEYLVSYVTPTI